MNILTHKTAYSLFPDATFNKREALVISTSGAHQEAARQKYAYRGWTMVAFDTLPKKEYPWRRSDFHAGFRWIGDDRTWRIPLDPPSAYHNDLSDVLVHTPDLLPMHSFGIEYSKSYKGMEPELKYQFIRNEMWRDIYAVADAGQTQASWKSVLSRYEIVILCPHEDAN